MIELIVVAKVVGDVGNFRILEAAFARDQARD